MKKEKVIEDRTKINQIYIEILCNIIRKQNIYLIEKICKHYDSPERVLIKQYVIKKLDVKNILTLFYS